MTAILPSIQSWRADFPILQQTMHGKPLVYLDSAASAQKPKVMLEALTQFYQQDYANVHRGVYHLSAQATTRYERARQVVQTFIQARHAHEIIFTSGTTAAINLVASTFAALGIQPGDEIIISKMEHHSNLVPWQVLCQRTGATLKVIEMDQQGQLDLEHYQQLLSARTRLVALTQVSNVLGTINPVHTMIQWAHQQHVPVLLDGAQAVPHLPIDVQALDCDFYTFSAHKCYGPTGVGVLYGKTHWLERLPPYQTGGNMIQQVSFEKTQYSGLPNKFEAGTTNIADIIAFATVLEYLQELGWPAIMAHEQHLNEYALEQLQVVPGLRLLGPTQQRLGVFSFVMAQAHPHDIGTFLDSEGVAVRVGHHCAMPLMEHLRVPATVRASLGLYNNEDDIERLCTSLRRAATFFG